MKTNYLLPNKFKIVGWVLFIIGIIGGIILLTKGYDYEPIESNVISLFNESYFGSDSMTFIKIINTGIANELVILLIILGALGIVFSKEKIEDEFIYKLRNDSLIWAFIFNYAVLILASIFIFDLAFFNILVFNMFTPLVFFIIRFNFLKLKARSNEE